MDTEFHPTHYNGCNHLSMLVLKLIHVSKRGPWSLFTGCQPHRSQLCLCHCMDCIIMDIIFCKACPYELHTAWCDSFYCVYLTTSCGSVWCIQPYSPVASFTKEVNPPLAKRPLVFNGHLDNCWFTSLVGEATGMLHWHCGNLISTCCKSTNCDQYA